MKAMKVSDVRTWLGSVALIGLLLLGSGLAQTTLTVATHYGPDQLAVLEPCFAAYAAENPGITIEHQQISYGDYLQTVLTSRIGGQAPDIYHLYNIWAPQMVDNGVLDVPPDDILAFLDERYVPAIVESTNVNGQVWGIPTEVSNYMLVYNKTLLAEAGYDAPPQTWDELVEMAAAITKRNDQGNIVTAGYAFGPSVANVVHPFMAMLASAGVDLFEEDFSGTNLTSPEAIAVLENQMRLFQEGITDASMEVWDFPSGSIAMMIHASWYESSIQEGLGDAYESTIGVAPIPYGDSRSLAYTFLFGVDANSRSKAEAWEFLRWLDDQRDEGGLSCVGEMLIGMGALTGNTADIAAGQDQLGDTYTAPFVEALDTAAIEPNVIQAAEIERTLADYIRQAWAGQLTAEEALTLADRDISNILSEFY